MRGLLFIPGVFLLFLASSGMLSANVLESLEKGEAQSLLQGDSFFVQSLVPLDVQEAFGKGESRALAELLPGLAFAEAFVTPSGQKLIYLKINGLGGGEGFLMHVEKGWDSLFENARSFDYQIPKDYPFQSGGNEGQLNDPWAATIQKELGNHRKFGSGDEVVMVGPLNQIISLAGVAVKLHFQIDEYIAESPKAIERLERSGLSAEDGVSRVVGQVSFLRKRPQGALGDVFGFGARRVRPVSRKAEEFLLSVR